MLTDTACRAAAAPDRQIKLADAGGLYLLVKPAGKYWRFDYRHGDKRKTLALGVYPAVTLAQARKKHSEARQLLSEGVDPGAARKARREALFADSDAAFELVAREWHAKQSQTWVPSHADRILRRLELDIFPWLGKMPVDTVTAPMLLQCLRRIEARGAGETAHRALQNCGQIMRYAIATGKAERDPAADLRGALAPVRGKHLAAVTEPAKLGPLLRALDDYEGSLTVRCALRLAPLLFVRPGELRAMRWADLDLEAREWRYLVTKTKTQHVVPLARQALEILQELQPHARRSEYVFPSPRSAQRPMSDNAILSALRRSGIGKDEASGHGFRATARTILDEVLGVRPDLIEHQLAHAVRDPNGRAYNRTAHLPARHDMMQLWADYLDKLKAGAQVMPLRA